MKADIISHNGIANMIFKNTTIELCAQHWWRTLNHTSPPPKKNPDILSDVHA